MQRTKLMIIFQNPIRFVMNKLLLTQKFVTQTKECHKAAILVSRFCRQLEKVPKISLNAITALAVSFW